MTDIEHILQINDMGGQEQWKFLINGVKNNNSSNKIKNNESLILKDAHLIVAVIDSLRYKASMKYISSVISSIEKYNRIYVATKKDLMNEETTYEVQKLELMMGDDFFLVSNENGENIENLIEKIQNIVSKRENYYIKDINKRYSKIVFVGLGGAGKSTLYTRLAENIFLENPKLTVGPSINTWHLHYQE